MLPEDGEPSLEVMFDNREFKGLRDSCEDGVGNNDCLLPAGCGR